FVTAAHLVPWTDPNPWMTFSPAWNIPNVNFGEWQCTRVRGAAIDDPSGDNLVAHDVAIGKLEYPLGNTLGFLGYNDYDDDWDGVGYWTSVGYPDDWNGNPAFEDADTVEDADSEGDGLTLETEASLNHGNSGGPFVGWFGRDPRVI